MAEPICEGRLKEALREALDSYFEKYGVDVNNPIEAQKDFAYLRKVRTGSETLTSKAILTIVSATVLATIGAVTAGFLQWVNGAGS